MRVVLISVTLSLVVACAPSGAGPASDAGSSDSGICSAGWPLRAEAAQGGRAVIAIPTGVDASTVSATTLPAGWALDVDADGGRLEVWLPYEAAAETTLVLEARCEGQAQRVEVTVAARALAWETAASWTPGVDGPTAREHSPLWLSHPSKSALMMFGGLLFEPKQWTPDDALWSLDFASGTWQRVEAAARPKTPIVRAAPVDGSRAPLLFGDDTSMSVVAYDNDTSSFSALPMAGQPSSGVSLGALVYDGANNRLLSICGISDNRPHCDVMALDLDQGSTATWRALKVETPEGAPQGRYGMFYGYSAEQQRVVIFSGARMPVMQTDPVNAAQDVWALELGGATPTWRRLKPAGMAPMGRRNGCFAYDEQGGRLLIWGGTPDARVSAEGLFALRLRRGQERWDRIDLASAPTVRSSCSGIFDAPRKRALFGFGNSEFTNFADLNALAL